MSTLAAHVLHSIRSRKLLRPGQPILVAVSGGVDSMVLLAILQELAPSQGWHLTVAHLNHQLRGRSSNADEALVRRTAQKLNLPVIGESANVRGYAGIHKLSLEMAARQVRHDFLARTAAQLEIPSIALAHHADDQLELFFLRLFRGSGSEGLAGMKWVSSSPSLPVIELVRPLLDQDKAALRDFAASRKIRFREDATNQGVDILRNRIRHELLPQLRQTHQPALDRVIPRVMDLLGAEAEYVTDAARQWLQQQQGPPFEALPLALQRRVLHLQLVALKIPPGFDLIEQLRVAPAKSIHISRPAEDREEARLAPSELVPVAVVRNANGTVQISPETAPTPFRSESVELNLDAGAGEVAFSGVRIQWQSVAKQGVNRPVNTPGCEFFDADRVGSFLVLRHWQPGDRFQPIGLSRPVKLQDLFTNKKILRPRRAELIVGATAQGEVFWVEALRISERFKLTEQTKRRLIWRWHRP